MITGHHVVKVFEFDGETHLPEGWKPFAVEVTPAGSRIVARKWVRDSKVDAVAWAEEATREAVHVRS